MKALSLQCLGGGVVSRGARSQGHSLLFGGMSVTAGHRIPRSTAGTRTWATSPCLSKFFQWTSWLSLSFICVLLSLSVTLEYMRKTGGVYLHEGLGGPWKILECVAIPFSGGFSCLIEPGSLTLQADSLPSEPPRKPPTTWKIICLD